MKLAILLVAAAAAAPTTPPAVPYELNMESRCKGGLCIVRERDLDLLVEHNNAVLLKLLALQKDCGTGAPVAPPATYQPSPLQPSVPM